MKKLTASLLGAAALSTLASAPAIAASATGSAGACTAGVTWDMTNASNGQAIANYGYNSLTCNSTSAYATFDAIVPQIGASVTPGPSGNATNSFAFKPTVLCSGTLSGSNTTGTLASDAPGSSAVATIKFGPIPALGQLWSGTEVDGLGSTYPTYCPLFYAGQAYIQFSAASAAS
jgi:hypothetical protein